MKIKNYPSGVKVGIIPNAYAVKCNEKQIELHVVRWNNGMLSISVAEKGSLPVFPFVVISEKNFIKNIMALPKQELL